MLAKLPKKSDRVEASSLLITTYCFIDIHRRTSKYLQKPPVLWMFRAVLTRRIKRILPCDWLMKRYTYPDYRQLLQEFDDKNKKNFKNFFLTKLYLLSMIVEILSLRLTKWENKRNTQSMTFTLSSFFSFWKFAAQMQVCNTALVPPRLCTTCLKFKCFKPSWTPTKWGIEAFRDCYWIVEISSGLTKRWSYFYCGVSKSDFQRSANNLVMTLRSFFLIAQDAFWLNLCLMKPYSHQIMASWCLVEVPCN